MAGSPWEDLQRPATTEFEEACGCGRVSAMLPVEVGRRWGGGSNDGGVVANWRCEASEECNE